jgi:D-3-phosphoglycerate dehydrogenase / 2-oxoglutarate reductase
MRDILIPEGISGPSVEDLRTEFDVLYEPDLWRDAAALEQKIAHFRALLVRNQTAVTGKLIAAAPSLEVIGRAGVGLDNVDVRAAQEAGVVVTLTPDQNAISVAELAIGMMLALARFIPEADTDTKNGNWNRSRFTGVELYGKTLGIVGAGKIGYLTAKRAQAFGMKIVAFDPYLSTDNILLSELHAQLLEIDELLERSDVVSCHLPATPSTKDFFNAARFRKMKSSAFFINTSRGTVVDEQDLAAALRHKTIAAAALDVRVTEPPPPGELESLPNVLLTPHVAAFTHEAQHRVTRAICHDVARVLHGQPALNAIGKSTPRNKKNR